MILEKYFDVGDVVSFDNADTPTWAKGHWRVAGLMYLLPRGERAEILPLTDSDELDAIRAVSARYFVEINTRGQSGLVKQDLRLASEAE